MLEETQQSIERSETLFRTLERLKKFNATYDSVPIDVAYGLVHSMQSLADTLTETAKPQNQDQLLQSELKRRLNGEALNLEQNLSGRLYDFDKVVKTYGIPWEDIISLRKWLEENKGKTKESIERLFHSREIEYYELPLPLDIPTVRRQAEEFTAVHIQRYHKSLGKFLQSLTKVGSFLRDITAVPTTIERSYFNFISNTLAISIPTICYMKEDGTLHIKERELIRLYGHEGMGHALNQILTRSNSLPYFLSQESYLTESTSESISQFYQEVLLEDLLHSKEIQKSLGIDNRFSDIYQDARDRMQLEDFNNRMRQYSITVLGDKTLGDPDDPKTLERKTELLSEVALNRGIARHFIQGYRLSFDSEGNLFPDIVSELRYCARPVDRALQEFSSRGNNYGSDNRSLIDSTLLTGLWTPTGFVDNARLVAESKI